MIGPMEDLARIGRRLARRPAYPLLALFILTLGLATTLGVLTYLNGFFQPFPGAEADGLVRIVASSTEEPYRDISYLDYLDLAEAQLPLVEVGAVQPFYAASVRHEEMTEVAFLEAVSGSFFPTAGVRMAIGRGILPDDDVEGAEPVAVISYAWWQSRWNGDPDVLGTTLFLNFRPHTIVGVAAPEFRGSTSQYLPAAWLPFAPFRARYTSWDRAAQDRDLPLVRVYARLAEGADEAQATQALMGVARSLDETYPLAEGTRAVRAETATWVDPRSRMEEAPRNRLMVLSVAGFLLLIVANVTNLLLALTESRKREFALQAALGADRWRIAGTVLAENMILASLASVLALAVALPLSRRLGAYVARPSIWGEFVPMEFGLDLRIVGATVALGLAVGALSALVPGVRAAGTDIRGRLSGSDGGGSGRGAVWLRDGFVGVQAALACTLLVVAGLMVRSLGVASDIDPGFRYAPLVASHISTSSTELEVEERRDFFLQVQEAITAEPWVEAATVTQYAPLSGHANMPLTTPGRAEPLPTLMTRVHRNFFDVVGIRVEEGRQFTPADSMGAPSVIVVNREAARRLFPGGATPVGQMLQSPMQDGGVQEFEVVGVAADARAVDFLSPPQPAVYLPFAQYTYPTGSGLLLAVNGDPRAAVPLMERWLRTFEPHLAIVNVLPYSEVVRGSVYGQRMNAEMFSLVALLGFILSAAGIFAVVGLSVARRSREFGIRLAIGAEPGRVRLQLLSEAVRPVAAGLVLGGLAAVALGSLLESLLFGVGRLDPRSFAVAALVLLLSALAAAWLPARRAGGTDPVVALRAD
jgi:predicted permease